MTISVDDAVEVLIAEAERHERDDNHEHCLEHDGHCLSLRTGMVAFVLLRLGLDLCDLGIIAEGVAGMREDAQDAQWPDVIGESNTE